MSPRPPDQARGLRWTPALAGRASVYPRLRASASVSGPNPIPISGGDELVDRRRRRPTRRGRRRAGCACRRRTGSARRASGAAPTRRYQPCPGATPRRLRRANLAAPWQIAPARSGGCTGRPAIVVVLPVYNEAESIRAVLAEVKEAAARLAITGVETTCIVVDDNSPDDSGGIAERYAKGIDLELTVVTGERNGLGDAMLRGLAAASTRSRRRWSRSTATASTTRSTSRRCTEPSCPWRRHRHWQPVDPRRSAPGTSPARTVGSRLGNWLFRAITGTRGVKDATTSFRVYSPRPCGSCSPPTPAGITATASSAPRSPWPRPAD